MTFVLACASGVAAREGDDPKECSDGADNNADGAFDCDDEGCLGAPACDPKHADDGTRDDGPGFDSPAPTSDPTDSGAVTGSDTAVTAGATGGVLIAEVTDWALDDDARYIELYNGGDIRSLTGLALRTYSNGSSTFAEAALPDGLMGPSTRFVIAYNQIGFEAAFGVAADTYSGVVSGNGNDVYELVEASSGVAVDVFGIVAADGTGEAWEYTDAVAQRSASVTSGMATFDIGQWTITQGTAGATPGY